MSADVDTAGPAEAAYRAAGDADPGALTGYGPLVASLGGETVVEETADAYEGDTFVLLRDGARYGFVTFGWGSCSGCDALQACTSWADVEALRDRIAADARWGAAAEVAEALRSEARSLDFYTGRWSWVAFRDKALAALDATFDVAVSGGGVVHVAPVGALEWRAWWAVAEGPPQEALRLATSNGLYGELVVAVLPGGPAPDPDVLEYVTAALRERDAARARAMHRRYDPPERKRAP